MQAAQGICVSGGMDVDCSGCGDIGDEFGDVLDDAVSDADGEE